MNLFRIQNNSKHSDDPKRTFQYCIDNKILGLGYAVDSEHDITNWDEYTRLAKNIYNKSNINYDNFYTVERMHEKVKSGDFCWTRSPDGEYYLAKATSGWYYKYNNEEIDIVNVFNAEIKIVPIDDVPGKVISSFRAPCAFQSIKSKPALIYSQFLWNKLNGINYKNKNTDVNDNIDAKGYGLWDLIDNEDVEDLIFIKLQMDGYIVIPHSRKKDTMSYEFYLIHKDKKNRAIVQTKTGGSAINRDDYKNRPETVYLFQPKKNYEGSPAENITEIESEALEMFIENNQRIIPGKILNMYKCYKDILKNL